jgi:glycosyltransferase involved in cell wall biosynthesis
MHMLKHVLVLTGAEPEIFKKHGGQDTNAPRLPQAYPYFGALQMMGVEVSVLSLGKVAQDRKAAKPSGWWTPYLSMISMLSRFAKHDVVITNGTQGALLALAASALKWQSKKIAIISFANIRGTTRTLAEPIQRSIYRRGLHQCGKVLFMTRRQMEEAVTKIGCEQTQLAYLPVGVDTLFFAPKPAHADACIREELRVLEAQKYIVVAGDQLRHEDHIMQVLEGMNVGLVRLTQNKYTEEFWRRWAGSNPSSFPVFCIAHLSAQEVRYAYQHALCLLNLVDSSWQPAGWTVMTEAMACQLPVIVNRGLTTEEMRLYIKEKDTLPFLEVEQLDPLEARRCLLQLMESTEKSQEIGFRARRFVEQHFNIEITAKTVYKILCEMVV